MRSADLAVWLGCILVLGCTQEEPTYVKYVPVARTAGGELVEDPDLLSPAHLEALKVVLRNYNEPFRLRADGVYIQQSLRADRDLLANYTSKAESFRQGTWKP